MTKLGLLPGASSRKASEKLIKAAEVPYAGACKYGRAPQNPEWLFQLDSILRNMQLLDDQLILSASDLDNYLACEHLTTLDLARARGDIEAAPERGADAELLARKGDQHELRYLESLEAASREVVKITLPTDGSRSALAAATDETAAALRAGPDVIYQATFLDEIGEDDGPGRVGALRGHADFLFRVDRPSALGDYSYEVADTKLARRAKPYFILQLCFYSELLAVAQGVNPERIHVILGDGKRLSFRLAEFSAYFRRVRDGFLAALAEGNRDTYPDPVEHCSVCRWRTVCDERRLADDHLSLVANINRRQRELLRGPASRRSPPWAIPRLN